MRATITQIHYCAALTQAQWERLNAIDHRGDDRSGEVHATLEKAGAIRRHTEYNGHFGRNIFFAIERATLLPHVLKAIEKLTHDPKPTAHAHQPT